MKTLRIDFMKGRFVHQLIDANGAWLPHITPDLHILGGLSLEDDSRVCVRQFLGKQWEPENWILCLRECIYADMLRSGWLLGHLRLVVRK